MAIVINPSDSAEYPIAKTTSGSITLSIGYIKSRIGTGNFILYWQGSNYAIARLTDTTGDVYVADALHVGFLNDNDIIYINGVNQKERFRYGYDPNTGGFSIMYGTELNFSARAYGGKTYIYYPVAHTDHPQAGIFTSYATLYINDVPVVQYVWSSVPAISGKNGILSLTQILNINDGEPVEDVTNKGNLDFSKKTKVNTLINSAYEPTYSEDETKATISYDIPESDYQYTKLVYKKKKIPKSASDGDVIDLNADATEIVVNNLDENSKYYFKIFTDKTQSNSYKYSTGSNPPAQGKWKETISYLKMITG